MKNLTEPNASSTPLMLFSVVIPARNEKESLPATLEHLHLEFTLNHVPHEIVVVDDGSRDKTWEVLAQLKTKIPTLRPIQNTGNHGFGRAITFGLHRSTGDAVVIMMADESDDARDAVRYWQLLNEGWIVCLAADSSWAAEPLIIRESSYS
jgi:dolichol-phosphate mannosyltransferase